jgi:hypothetical protein
MSINLFNHESCLVTSQISSAYCAEMSTSIDPAHTRYLLPILTMPTSNILSVYLGVKINNEFQLIKVAANNWVAQTGNYIQLSNQNPTYLQLYNRIIVIPKNALNLSFTGVAGSNIENKRPVWIKRSDNTKMYDYLAVTSIDYFANFYTILEFNDVQFTNGVGTGFVNLTSNHQNMKVDFDGQYVGGVSAINGVASLTLDTTFTSTGPSRAFLYCQGSLEFAPDVNGFPGTWQRHLTLPAMDTDIAQKFWLRDFRPVTSSLTVHANNAIRILGTEFLL